MDRLSDGYLVRTSESLYSVQSMANIRIRLIFDSSNTLVNRLGPILLSEYYTFTKHKIISHGSQKLSFLTETEMACGNAL